MFSVGLRSLNALSRFGEALSNARSRGAPGQPSIPVRSLPRRAGGKNCSGCYWSHAGRKAVCGKKSLALAEAEPNKLGFSLISAENDVVNLDLWSSGSRSTDRGTVGVFKGKEKLAQAFFPTKSKVSEPQVSSLSSDCQVPVHAAERGCVCADNSTVLSRLR